MMMMAIQKILLSVVSKFVVGVCDGLDACEISRPEILSQSTPGGRISLIPLSQYDFTDPFLHTFQPFNLISSQ